MTPKKAWKITTFFYVSLCFVFMAFIGCMGYKILNPVKSPDIDKHSTTDVVETKAGENTDLHYRVDAIKDRHSELIKYVVITSYTGNSDNVVIPQTIENLPVEKIEASCFNKNENIRSVTIPSSVNEIGSFAFFCCSKLEIVKFAKEMNNLVIGDSAFRECVSLREIRLPSGDVELGNASFKDCVNLSMVKYENRCVLTVKSASFSRTCITKIMLPESTTYIGNTFFSSPYTTRKYSPTTTKYSVPPTPTDPATSEEETTTQPGTSSRKPFWKRFDIFNIF